MRLFCSTVLNPVMRECETPLLSYAVWAVHTGYLVPKRAMN